MRIDRLSGEDAQTLKAWLEPILETVDARVLVADDADALKTAARVRGLRLFLAMVFRSLRDVSRRNMPIGTAKSARHAKLKGFSE